MFVPLKTKKASFVVKVLMNSIQRIQCAMIQSALCMKKWCAIDMRTFVTIAFVFSAQSVNDLVIVPTVEKEHVWIVDGHVVFLIVKSQPAPHFPVYGIVDVVLNLSVKNMKRSTWNLKLKRNV